MTILADVLSLISLFSVIVGPVGEIPPPSQFGASSRRGGTKNKIKNETISGVLFKKV